MKFLASVVVGRAAALGVSRVSAGAVLAATLAGCASLMPVPAGTPGAPVAVAAGSAGSAASAPPARGASGPAGAASAVPPGTPQAGPPPGGAQPFATVIKDAKKTDGLLTLYQKDEKFWIELKPTDFNKPFFLSPKLATGIGEARLFGGLMQEESVIEFRRIHNLVQMIVRNTAFTAKPGTPEGRAVAASFSPSLLASTPVASQPHPTAKSVLVEANALFVNDMLGIGMHLQRSFRQGYAFDPRNSAITQLRSQPDSMQLQVLAHYATGSIAVPQPGTPPGAPVPTAPFALPDARSMFITVHYALSALPEQPMHARPADARVGHFTAAQWDFSDDLARTPIVRHVSRWRLEKKDPAAAMSEPVKPIVFWLDRTIPLKYREAVAAGVLEWNRAFERIGFIGAIDVKVQPDDADFDTLDGGASIRWMTNAAPIFGAIGPSHVDPRSGEILGANIGLESLSSRNLRASRSQILGSTAADVAKLMQLGTPGVGDRFDARACENAEQSAEQLSYAFDVLAARGELDPASPEAERFVLDYMKEVTMHEVGHTLGMRHNFRASRIYTDAQVSDNEFTRVHGHTGSVMEYPPVNLASPGAPPLAPFQTTLGPYDYWAIEYAYKPIAAASEKGELAKIAGRNAEPELAYGTDEDNYLGIDPDALHFDLGSDPIAFAKKRLAIARDLFKRQEARELPPNQDYGVLRRSLNYAINDAARSVGVLARQIGGVRTLRDFPGTGRDPLQPVTAQMQRDALDTLASGVLSADAFVISPGLQRRLAPDFQERTDALERGQGGANIVTDFSLTQRVLAVQRALLNQLMSDTVAARIIDSQDKAPTRAEAFQLVELYGRLDRDIWSELARGVDIAAPRRELQRDFLNRVATFLLRPAAATRADTRSLARSQAQALLVRLNGAALRPGLSADTRAHLQDSADTLSQALSAKLLRAGA